MSDKKDYSVKTSIDAEAYPSNSHTKKAAVEKKKVEQVATGKVTRKKPSLSKRVTGSLVSEDADKDSVFSYIMYDVLIPATKSMISDMVSGGVEMLLFGSTRGARRGTGTKGAKVQYNRVNRSYDQPIGGREISYTDRARHNFDEITLDSRGEAEEILSKLVELADVYGAATVADLYDLAGVTSDWSDNKYGWENLSRAYVERTRGGYLINLPKTVVLK